MLVLPHVLTSQPQNSKIDPPATFNLDADREPMVCLDGLWHFHPGDDPRWSDPTFDDSQWPLIRSDQSWSNQSYSHLKGTAWYRASIVVPAGSPPLSLYIPEIRTSYEVFVDGKLLAQYGGMPPRPAANTSVPIVIPIPAQSANHILSIAIRVWLWPQSLKGGGITGGLRIGESALIGNWGASQDRDNAWGSNSSTFLTLLEILAGITALAFFCMCPREREYLWFGVWMLLCTFADIFYGYSNFHAVPILAYVFISQLIPAMIGLASMAFYRRILAIPKDWLFWLAAISNVAPIALAIPVVYQSMSGGLFYSLSVGLVAPWLIWIFVWLLRRAWTGLTDARLLLISFLLEESPLTLYALLSIAKLHGLYHGSFDKNIVYTWQWPFPFSVTNIGYATFFVTMMAIFIRRFMRTRQIEERLISEIDAARNVQQVLIPEEIPSIPGFSIRSVYRPYGEVGGDFFQILPTPGGGILLTIGDVSGKGMPAAMTVALLVGTLRTLANFTTSPGEILATMNQRMLARSAGGFTTCLVLRIDSDGTLTAANAGHLAPYLNRDEIKLESGLPLGLVASTSYPEKRLILAHDDQLTLITDGVVEARAKSGELLGFERTAELSSLSAEEIAEKARHFGQEDDITVLTLTRVSTAASSSVQIVATDLTSSLA